LRFLRWYTWRFRYFVVCCSFNASIHSFSTLGTTKPVSQRHVPLELSVKICYRKQKVGTLICSTVSSSADCQQQTDSRRISRTCTCGLILLFVTNGHEMWPLRSYITCPCA
jgi:hypothetical protein